MRLLKIGGAHGSALQNGRIDVVIFLGCLLGLSIVVISFIISAWGHSDHALKGTWLELKSFNYSFMLFCIVASCALSIAFMYDVNNAHRFKEACHIKNGIVIKNPDSGKLMCVNPTMYDAHKVPDYVISLEK